MTNELKPCPFCGIYPNLVCDITDWMDRPVYKAYNNGYRPIVYHLYAEHKHGCFITSMNGTNDNGEMTSTNYKHLLDVWNRRANDERTD